MQYAEITFQDGDDGRAVVDRLYNVEGVVAHGVTDESLTAALDHLRQWDYGDDVRTRADIGAGTLDDIFDLDDYVLTANLGLGYVSLHAKVVDWSNDDEDRRWAGE